MPTGCMRWACKRRKERSRSSRGGTPRRRCGASLRTFKELIPRAEYQTLVQCLSLALDIEKALIEKKFFVVFAGDSPAFARLLKRLAAATGKHIEAVRKMWEKHRL